MKYDLILVRNPGSILLTFVGAIRAKSDCTKIIRPYQKSWPFSFLCGWRNYAANKKIDKSLAFCSLENLFYNVRVYRLSQEVLGKSKDQKVRQPPWVQPLSVRITDKIAQCTKWGSSPEVNVSVFQKQ